MKHIVFASVFLVALNLYSQDKFENHNVSFDCGISRNKSKAVLHMEQLVVEKDFDAIRSNLQSKQTAKQFLAIVVLEILNEKNHIQLDYKEQDRINRLKQSGSIIFTCSGCVYQEVNQFEGIFSSDNNHFLLKSAKEWAYKKLNNN